MLPLSVFGKLAGAIVLMSGTCACSWPPLSPRVTTAPAAPPREACGFCTESRPAVHTAQRPQPEPTLQRAALELRLKGAGSRFVAAAPDAAPASEAPFRLGTTALSPLGAEAVRSFDTGKTEALPRGSMVLHIGDSFAGALGIPLRQELARHGVKSALHFQTSTYIPTWAHHKKLPLYLLQYKPDLVVITLGGNELAIDAPERRAGTIRRLVKQLGDRPCVWIVPPLWKEENGLTRVIRESCAPCRFMDTNALIQEMPRADGVHPTPEARVDWAKLVVAWLAGQRDPAAGRPWELREQ